MTLFPRRWIMLAAAGIVAASTTASIAQPQILREGTGERRAALDKMELTKFDHSLWSHLSDWRNGQALTGAEADGKVVVIYTWSDWYIQARRTIPLVQRLHEKYADRGLIIIGAHHEKGWDVAPAAASEAGVTFRIAHDAKSAFRDALLVDQDPDFYVIDRAGRMRYADIQTSSVEAAVEELIAETKQQAMGVPEALEALRRAGEEAAQRTGLIRQGVDIARIPDLPFPRPSEAEYERAKWPTRWREYEQQVLQIQQPFGSERPPPIQLSLPSPTEQAWFGQPLKTAGRAVVLYFWAPDIYRSYDRVQPQMDLLQKERVRDVAVIGVLTPKLIQSQTGQMTQEQVERERREFIRLAQRARTERNYEHSIYTDPEAAVLSQVLGSLGSRQAVPVPLAVIASTDNVVRWIGPPTDNRFMAALDRVLSEDPAVRNRRAVEAEWIRTNQQQDP